MAWKWPRNGPEMGRKWPRKGPEMARKWPGNGSEMAQKKATKPPHRMPTLFSAEIGTILFEAHHSVDSYSFGGSARGIS